MRKLSERVHAEVQDAAERIRPYARVTPLEYSHYLSGLCGCQAYMKLENYQMTGSFKLRGAVNKVLSLGPEDRAKTLVTSSTGNHGSAFAWALDHFGLKGRIYVPENIEPSKLDYLRSYSVEIVFHGTDCVESEKRARESAAGDDVLYIPPYNDMKIIGGQGTVAAEIENQAGAERIDCILCPVGGGGLASGVSGYLRAGGGGAEIIGCQPKNSPVMAESVKAGRIIKMQSKPTLSDGTAGGIESGAVTFDICDEYVDDFILVSESDIKEAIKIMLTKHFMLVEGAAALPVASLVKNRERFSGKRVVLIITGSKLDPERLRNLLK